MKKGKKDKIIEAAIKLFSQRNYEAISVVEICKTAEVSNGIFYTYFKDKTDLFCFLLQETANRIRDYFEGIEGNTVFERLKSFIDINITLTKEQFALIKVYREGQYKFLDYEKNLKVVYHEALERIYQRPLDKYEHFFLMSGIRHINIFYASRKLHVDSTFVAKILTSGLSESLKLTIAELEDSSFYLRVPFNSSNTRCSFLNSGLDILQTTPFSSFRVQDLVEKASSSTGTFYNYFSDKEEFLKIILFRIRKQIFHFLKDNYRPERPTLDNYLLFLYLLFEYYKDGPFKYSLMREIELIYPTVYSQFVEEDVDFYVKDLLGNSSLNFQKKQLIAVFLLGYCHYMGIDFFYTHNFSDRNKFLESLLFFLQNGIEE